MKNISKSMASFLDGKYFIGQRVLDAEDYRGTIQYIGPVASAKKATDIWLGKTLTLTGIHILLCICSSSRFSHVLSVLSDVTGMTFFTTNHHCLTILLVFCHA